MEIIHDIVLAMFMHLNWKGFLQNCRLQCDETEGRYGIYEWHFDVSSNGRTVFSISG